MMKTKFLTMCVMAAVLALAGAAQAAEQNAIAYDAYTGSVGTAYSAHLHDYGTAVTTVVAGGNSYAGIASKVVGVDVSVTGGDPTYYLADLKATIRAGTNTGGETTVSMAWRNRTDIEYSWIIGRIRNIPGQSVPPGETAYPSGPPLAWDSLGVVSNVVELVGLNGAYVLEMDYNEDEIIYEVSGPPYSEAGFAQGDWIYLGWFDIPDYNGWTHATGGNFGTGTSPVENYQGSFDDFLLDYTFSFSAHLGSYGVDIEDNTVWAVLNHTSEFTVIPEPATLLLLGLGAVMVRRRK